MDICKLSQIFLEEARGKNQPEILKIKDQLVLERKDCLSSQITFMLTTM